MENVNKKYKIIYADPPWQYHVWGKKGDVRSAERHYRTHKVDDLKALNIPAICDKNCLLFMWATFPCLQDAFSLGAAWGFRYKTVAFVWVKQHLKSNQLFTGLGYYTRANAEIVLLFSKGKPLKRIRNDIPQVLISKRGKHSVKPPEIRERIVQLLGDLPRLELFARSRQGFFPDEEYKGWDVFGNQVNNSVLIERLSGS